jgi:hypothetical protein
MTLFSYCIPTDDGAAPNPFWDVCTLAICKPVIRRTAKIGDWVVATGSTRLGFQNQVVYAMKVTNIMTLSEYDEYCNESLTNKVPDWNNNDLKRKLGDCIYDFSTSNSVLRKSVHHEGNIKTDEGGKNVLLSDHFYYFGSIPVPLPGNLQQIVKQGQGHKSISNDPYKDLFVSWIENSGFKKNVVENLPYGIAGYVHDDCASNCSKLHQLHDEEDEKIAYNEC